MNLERKLETILFFKNEPQTIRELGGMLGVSPEEVQSAVSKLQEFYKERGIVIVTDGEYVSFGTHPDSASLVESLQKEELSREIGRAGIETLSIILYKGPVSRREIDYIRGVSSGFILRNLLIRGLIERAESDSGERSYSYKPTLKLMQYLGVTNRSELPEFQDSIKKLEQFIAESPTEESEN